MHNTLSQRSDSARRSRPWAPAGGFAPRAIICLPASLLALLSLVAIAQDPEPLQPPASEPEPSSRRSPTSQSPLAKSADQDAAEIICLGATRSRLRELLGRPTQESLIPSLRRVREWYLDGTEVTYLENRAISIVPGDRAEPTAEGHWLIRRDDRSLLVDRTLLRECGDILPDPWLKCAIEESYWFCASVDGFPMYGDLRFTPPRASGPYLRAYVWQFGAPHFFWPHPDGLDWSPMRRSWNFDPGWVGQRPRVGKGYYTFAPDQP